MSVQTRLEDDLQRSTADVDELIKVLAEVPHHAAALADVADLRAQLDGLLARCASESPELERQIGRIGLHARSATVTATCSVPGLLERSLGRLRDATRKAEAA